MRTLRLIIQRLLVLLLGVVTVWAIAFVFFDVADRRLPLVLALAATYGFAAYIILPRAIRLGLRVLGRGHVPSYTTTGDGLPGDPVNLALMGTKAELRSAFAAAGWNEADKLGLVSSWRMAVSFVLDRPYPTAPFSTLYLFGRGQDAGFQRAIGDSPRKRHHVRFWGLPVDRAAQLLENAAFWSHDEPPAEGETVIWIGAGTRDTNSERDYIMGELTRVGVIGPVRTQNAGERLGIGKVNRYVTDGEVAVAALATAASPGA
jgi:hypothetical protein